MKYLSVCSGIEAASVAWRPLGWSPVAFSEIEAFPSAVLAERFPGVPNWGDMTKWKEWPDADVDVLVGGTPCQSFSVAGLRAGLADPRGNLALTYLAIADRYRPRWLLWENVPGVLSSNEGRDFGAFLGGLGKLGYGFAYRVLDAQFFGVAQRRRRVFVVGHAGDWRRAAAVLFERESLSGHPAPRREAREGAAPTIGCGAPFSRTGNDRVEADALIASTGDIWHCLNAGGMGRQDYETETLVAHTLRGEGFDAGEDGTGRGTPLVPVAIQERAVSENLENGPGGKGYQEGVAYTLEARNKVQAVAFDWQSGGDSRGLDPKDTAQLQRCQVPAVAQINSAVRRLTPRECERLQGFPAILDRVRIEVWHCSDLRLNNAPAETPNPRSPRFASTAGESASPQHANLAATPLNTSRHGRDLPVALNVLIDLERGEVQFRKAGRLIWSANTAAKPSASRLPMPADAFVRLVALMTQTAVPRTLAGRVESPHSINSSSPALLGSACVSAFGREIEEFASDAAKLGMAAENCMKSTTSRSGRSSPNLDWSLRTLSSCVTAATSSFIPSETRQANSYAVTVDLIQSFTAVTYRNKPAADGPRYKALGNSMAVPVMEWIGRRIQMVEDMT